MERFGDVVVGAEIEAAHPVLDSVARGHDEHRHLRAPHARAFEHLESVESGKADVEQHDVVVGREQRAVGVMAVVDEVDGVG